MFVQAPVLLVGPIWLFAVVLTLLTAESVHGLWLVLLILAVLHIVIINALIIRYLNTDTIIQSMLRRGWITASGDQVYFALPFRLERDAGLPGWLYHLVWFVRAFWIAVCMIGAVVYGPGVYSSVGVTERVLSVTGTLALGMGVLFTRLWQIPLSVAIQHRLERDPLPTRLDTTSQATA